MPYDHKNKGNNVAYKSLFSIELAQYRLSVANFQSSLCPWQESNLHLKLRRLPFYPLNYKNE